MENFAVWRVLTNLTARAGYTWLHSEDLDTGMELVRRPEHSGSVNLDWKIFPKFDADLNALFAGRRADENFDVFPATPVELSGYTKLDLAVRWRIQKYLEVFARAENLLNENYQEVYGYPELGRGFYGGLRAQF